jgi:hypothetical protein
MGNLILENSAMTGTIRMEMGAAALAALNFVGTVRPNLN